METTTSVIPCVVFSSYPTPPLLMRYQVLGPMLTDILGKGLAFMMEDVEIRRVAAGGDDDETDDPSDPEGWSAPAVLRHFFKEFLVLPTGGGGADHRQFLAR